MDIENLTGHFFNHPFATLTEEQEEPRRRASNSASGCPAAGMLLFMNFMFKLLFFNPSYAWDFYTHHEGHEGHEVWAGVDIFSSW
ncbi:MAG: hypothetical protein KKD44_24235 [Proteobacteria bacterium]|nr:hypothetical protein [Pseudomonadota bacterium]